jgi:hypothetical protein
MVGEKYAQAVFSDIPMAIVRGEVVGAVPSAVRGDGFQGSGRSRE